MKLLIAIPALNEEESIAAVIERTLQARARGTGFSATWVAARGSARFKGAARGRGVGGRACRGGLILLRAGLHFPPAMSARAILADDLTLVEVDVPYETRTGRSKLRP